MSNRTFSGKGNPSKKSAFAGKAFRKKNTDADMNDIDDIDDINKPAPSGPTYAKEREGSAFASSNVNSQNSHDEDDYDEDDYDEKYDEESENALETEFASSFSARIAKLNSAKNEGSSDRKGNNNGDEDSKHIGSSDLATDLKRLDENIRPRRLEDFVGQGELRKNLRVYLDATKKRKKAMDHLLFYGNPGLGKTTLAHIIASELGVNLVSTSGPALMRGGDLAAILSNLQENDVFFIDEIHRMPMQVEEVLYPALEDFKLDLVIGQGPAAKTVKLDIEPFTLVGATTRLGLLSSPLRDRFGIISRLEFYTPQELSDVVIRAARIMDMSITAEGAMEIGKRSRGTPRIANRLLRRVRDFASVSGSDIINEEQAKHALSRLDVDEMGLDEMDRKILSILIDHYDGGPVGLKTLAVACSEEIRTIEEIYEPYLIQCGLIKRTSQGRTATQRAYKHLGY